MATAEALAPRLGKPEQREDREMTNEITMTRESAERICEQLIDATMASKKALNMVKGLLWHIDTMMDYDCDGEVYDRLLEIEAVLDKAEKSLCCQKQF